MEKIHGILMMILLNMLIFDVDNGSSTHTDNQKNNPLVLVEGTNQLLVLMVAIVQQKNM